MSKKNKEEEENKNGKPITVTSADIKDGFCNYVFEVNQGVGSGDNHKVSGRGIIKDDMRTAFNVFNAHMACIDEAFFLKDVKITDIDKLHNHELTAKYQVNGFQVKGFDENISVVLIGTKYIGALGRIDIKTPKIPLDKLSGYKWFDELKTALEEAVEEVELYRKGKCDMVEEPTVDSKQLNIGHEIEAAEKNAGEKNSAEGAVKTGNKKDFSKAKV